MSAAEAPNDISMAIFTFGQLTTSPLNFHLAGKLHYRLGGRLTTKMVCAKCQKLNKTTLATPGVKKKSEMYYGSPASATSSLDKKPATLGQTGVSKVC